MIPPAIHVDGLCKTYPAFRLDNVSFCAPSGQIVGFIGRNGAGKTTTLKSLLHIVQPDAGLIRILGLDMDRHELEIRQQIGFVTGGASYYPKKRLSDITAVTRGFFPEGDEARYRDCLRRFRLDEGKKVCELSQGMQVKYQLALALSHKARVLILDEPTSGLDPVSRDDLLDLFRTLIETEVACILFSTHITSDLDACSDHIVYIQNGRILADQSKADFESAYVLVQGAPAQLTPALDAALLGAKKHRADFTGLLRAEDAALADGCRVSKPDLQTIMVHLEKEAEE